MVESTSIDGSGVVVSRGEQLPCRPVLKWAGDKSKVLLQMQAFFTESFNCYIEPFLGGGAVFLTIDVPKELLVLG